MALTTARVLTTVREAWWACGTQVLGRWAADPDPSADWESARGPRGAPGGLRAGRDVCRDRRAGRPRMQGVAAGSCGPGRSYPGPRTRPDRGWRRSARRVPA